MNLERGERMKGQPTEPVFKLLAFDPVRRVWTIRSTCDGLDALCLAASRLRQRGLRVRVLPGVRKVLTIKPDNNTASRLFREQQMQASIELADAKKRYKSPG